MNKHLKEHITWLEGRQFLLVNGMKRKPNARDMKAAKTDLRKIRAVLKKLRA